MSTDDELFTPEEVLGGFSAKRARLLLFQIESRTASLMLQSRRAVDRYLTEEIAEQQDLAFFEALAEGRELPVRPTIRDLERYAPHWQSLVPRNRTLQAALAHFLGQKYRFAQRDIPRIRRALGLDSEGVQQAFQRQYRQPLDTIYSRRVSLLERIGWQWNKLSSWLENLPPFWTAYALTVTEAVGATILALPIALTGVGPLPGVVILFVMGVINILTIAAMAEAVTRNGSIRYQGSYLGRLVQDYLGRAGSLILTAMVVTICFLALLAYYLGFSLTLAGATPIGAEVWAGVLFLLGFYFVRRKTLHATVSSALVVGAINLGLILILSGLALGHLRVENLLYVHVPFLNGQPFEPALLGLIFGVIFAAYFGHFSVNSCARSVLQRDPSGRSLALGCMAAQASAMILYILWVVAVNGAIAPQVLAGFSGTALTPLAQLAGPAVNVFGVLLAILAMGMASIHFSLALFFTVREWIPGQSRHTLLLGRRQGKLMFTPRGKANVSLALTYLGLKGTQPQFRLDLLLEGNTRRFEVEVHDTWEAATTLLAEPVPKLPPQNIQLTLNIVTASADMVRMQLVTSMRMKYEGTWDTLGLDFQEMAETAETPDMTVVSWLAGREQASVEEVADVLEQSEQATQTVLNRLVEQGVLLETREHGQAWYHVHFAARRRRQATRAIWQALDDSGKVATRKRDAVQRMQKGRRIRRLGRLKELVQGEYARSWLGLSPLFLIFLVVEWLLIHKLESFSQVLSFVGIVAVAVMAGVFPVLLLLASRRKGEHVPGFVLPFLAHPLVAGSIYLVAVSILFLHGLFIWQNAFQRVVAILVGVVILAMTSFMVRKGAFARRLVIEVRQEPAVPEQSSGTFTVTDCGRAATQARVELGYADGERLYQAASGAIPEFPELCSALFHLPGTKAQELLVWVHRVTPEGQSEQLPALLRVRSGKDIREFHLDGARKQFILPLRESAKKDSKGSTRETDQLEIEVQLAGKTARKK
jgi:amino acid permease/predicted transcriptional regulator